MKKKFLVLIVSLLMLFAAGTTSVFAEGDASAQLVPDFSDDFESYEVTGNPIEEDTAVTEKWENNVFRGGDSRRGENETEKQDLAHVKRLH